MCFLSLEMAEPTGLEPAISGVTGRRVNQLHHGSNKVHYTLGAAAWQQFSFLGSRPQKSPQKSCQKPWASSLFASKVFRPQHCSEVEAPLTYSLWLKPSLYPHLTQVVRVSGPLARTKWHTFLQPSLSVECHAKEPEYQEDHHLYGLGGRPCFPPCVWLLLAGEVRLRERSLVGITAECFPFDTIKEHRTRGVWGFSAQHG